MKKEPHNQYGDVYVSHFVGLSGVGGVQRNFVEYLNYEVSIGNKKRHQVFTLGNVDPHYVLPVKVRDIRNLRYLIVLIWHVVSRKKIVHLYNNLTSIKLAILLLFLPTCKLILHERGTVWNLSSKRHLLIRFVAWKSDLILANSNATKTMLVKKFFVPSSKVLVIHNGIDVSKEKEQAYLLPQGSKFRVGFIGRLDTPKGVHVLIAMMHHLSGEAIELIIAGDGVLEDKLKNQAQGLGNVVFVGRALNPYVFMSQIDLLVVPSIREPLGNVCLEAGLCKVPVLASNVDGIPEIIENHFSGELIKPTQPLAVDLTNDAVPLPEWVVEPATQKLKKPMQIDPVKLAERVLFLSQSPELLSSYAENLQQRVQEYFSISRYAEELGIIYQNLSYRLK